MNRNEKEKSRYPPRHIHRPLIQYAVCPQIIFISSHLILYFGLVL